MTLLDRHTNRNLVTNWTQGHVCRRQMQCNYLTGALLNSMRGMEEFLKFTMCEDKGFGGWVPTLYTCLRVEPNNTINHKYYEIQRILMNGIKGYEAKRRSRLSKGWSLRTTAKASRGSKFRKKTDREDKLVQEEEGQTEV